MTMQSNFRRMAAVAAAALAMALGAGVVVAQTTGGPHGPGPGGHHGFGAGGPQGSGGGDAMIGNIIQKAKTQLNLNSGQQVAFDDAVAASKAARDAARERHQKVRVLLQEELAKAEPNLAAVAAAADAAMDDARAARKPIRDKWLNLYATFNAEQKAVVRDMLQKRIAHMESFRQKMHEWMQQRSGATNG